MRAYLRELQAPGALSWRTAADLTRPLARWPQPLRPGHGAGPTQWRPRRSKTEDGFAAQEQGGAQVCWGHVSPKLPSAARPTSTEGGPAATSCPGVRTTEASRGPSGDVRPSCTLLLPGPPAEAWAGEDTGPRPGGGSGSRAVSVQEVGPSPQPGWARLPFTSRNAARPPGSRLGSLSSSCPWHLWKARRGTVQQLSPDTAGPRPPAAKSTPSPAEEQQPPRPAALETSWDRPPREHWPEMDTRRDPGYCRVLAVWPARCPGPPQLGRPYPRPRLGLCPRGAERAARCHRERGSRTRRRGTWGHGGWEGERSASSPNSR
ncbi:translation initiation factor IF-2-like [Rousettus aegyptiacus]|uniref:translation initiation factor IF-2-like n=1 Tax=Rousettus aegyptiacus TaxID=9407 RepID=UPI00168D5E31|nr:translation initiation factor IF-2-like [Rousettus aegyptiacus]